MATTYMQRFILAGLGIGVVVGLIVGAIGAYLGIPPVVRGALTGVLIVVALRYAQKQMKRDESS
jgi:hypothetical protein